MADEVKTEETPPVEPVVDVVPPTPDTPPTEATPGDGEAVLDEAAIADFLQDEGDDLDAPEEPTPPPSPTEGLEPPEGPEPPKPAEAPPEVAPSPPAEPKPAEAAPTPAPEAPKPEQPPPVVPEAAPAEQPPVLPSMDEIRATYQENREKMEAMVASEVYNLSDDQVQRLDDGDSQLIPELMAKVYMDAVTGSVAHMITHLPSIVENILTGRDQSSELESKFYDFWPALNKEEHGETVRRFGASYRQLYPNASLEEFVRDVGAQTIVALKIPPTETPGAETPPVVVPTTPPFQPARSGGGGAAPAAPVNVFEAMALEPEDLDLD